MNNNTTISIDFRNFDELVEIMDTYGTMDHAIFGENSDGESMLISIFEDRITTDTFQNNGWTRTNTYWRDGNIDEIYSKD